MTTQHEDASLLAEPTLVLVDVQQIFMNDMDQMLHSICNLVIDAIDHNRPVVVVEIIGGGPLVEAVRKLLENYPRHRVVPKPGADGAAEVLEACWDSGFPSSAFKLCGVAFACCVTATARGLLSFDPCASVSIVVPATDGRYVSAGELDTGDRRVQLDWM